jgi:hypothetical protein
VRRLALAVALGVLAIGVAAAAAAVVAIPGKPPAGKVLLGMVGPDPDGFDRLTGKHHVLHVIFGGFRGDVTQLLAKEQAKQRLPVLSLSSTVAPADIARGAEDAWLIGLSKQLHEAGVDVWVRILPEMNGGWNTWCAFDESGRPRGAKHSTASFVRAFRRMAVILRGGSAAAVNRRLAAATLPPLRGAVDIPASGKVGVVWNPQGHGTPFIAANEPSAYWPGPGYVDIVANDMYSDSGEPSWQGMDKLYAYGKPYLVAEWALEVEDDVEFARRMFAWVAAHPRTIGLVYFNKGWSGGSGIYELRSKPRGLALYRAQVRHPRYLASVP